MVKISVGMMGSSVANGSASLSTPSQVSTFLAVAKKHGVKELDTARVYNSGRSEELLGETHAWLDFSIATKAPAFSPGSLSEKKILENCDKSLKALKMEKVDIYYLHGPDSKTPLGEQCRAIDTLAKQGKFEQWGVSNLTPGQVQEVYDICTKEGYELPNVYQGGYNPLSRPNTEGTLLPLLRKLGMQFYAYSPLAGGLLAKPISQIQNPEKGSRFDTMKVFGDMYLTDENVIALKRLQSACDAEQIPLAEATMRWFVHHSPLGKNDAVILGASSDAQLEKTLAACDKAPLPDKVLEAIEELKEKGRMNLPSM
jgi:aflatoxin B1 aldehyde reductase